MPDLIARTTLSPLLPVLLCALVAACTPTVKVEAPREPITINLNVKLDADVRLRLIEEAEDDVEDNPIF
jgi:hypothetical protein